MNCRHKFLLGLEIALDPSNVSKVSFFYGASGEGVEIVLDPSVSFRVLQVKVLRLF